MHSEIIKSSNKYAVDRSSRRYQGDPSHPRKPRKGAGLTQLHFMGQIPLHVSMHMPRYQHHGAQLHEGILRGSGGLVLESFQVSSASLQMHSAGTQVESWKVIIIS